jgi:hypothetical protein
MDQPGGDALSRVDAAQAEDAGSLKDRRTIPGRHLKPRDYHRVPAVGDVLKLRPRNPRYRRCHGAIVTVTGIRTVPGAGVFVAASIMFADGIQPGRTHFRLGEWPWLLLGSIPLKLAGVAC